MRINGQATEQIAAMDRAAMYGDGVFRTLKIQRGKVVCWTRHYRKLVADCAALGIVCPEEAVLRDELAAEIANQPDGVAKIVISRGVGGRGYKPAPDMTPTRMVLVFPGPAYPEHYWLQGVALRVCDIRLAPQPALAGIKHLNRLENVLARREWDDPEIAEGLLLDQAGYVIEATMSNLFLRQGSVMRTPDLSQCGVAGVQRERILELAPRLGLRAEIGRITLDELYGADEVWLCNSVIGVWPVRAIGSQAISQGETARQINNLLENETD